MCCPQLYDSTFFDSLKMGHGHDPLFKLLWKSAETSRKIWEGLFYFYFLERLIFRRKTASPRTKTFFWRGGGCIKRILGKLFFFWKTLAPCVLRPWPRESMSSRRRSLAFDFFCSWPLPRRLRPRLHP